MSIFKYDDFVFADSSSGAKQAILERVKVTESPEYAEGGIKVIAKRVVFEVEGLMVGSSASNLKTKIKEARGVLLNSWQSLSYQHDSDDLVGSYDYFVPPNPRGIRGSVFSFESNSPDETPNAFTIRGTPKPLSLSFPAFIGDSSCKINYSVEVVIAWPIEGTAEQRFTQDIAQFWYDTRWSYDENFFPTITVAGILELRDGTKREKFSGILRDRFDMTKRGQFPWKPMSSDFQWNTSTSQLSFVIIHAQKQRALPRNIASGRATVRLSANRSRVNKIFAGTFNGFITTTNAQLVAAVFNILTSRFSILGLKGAATNARDFLTQMDVAIDLYQPIITFSFTAKALGTLVDVDNVQKLFGAGLSSKSSAGSFTNPITDVLPDAEGGGAGATTRVVKAREAREPTVPVKLRDNYIFFNEVVEVQDSISSVTGNPTNIITPGQIKIVNARLRDYPKSGTVFVVRAGVMSRALKPCEAPSIANSFFTLSNQKGAGRFRYVKGRVMSQGWRPAILEGTFVHTLSYVYIYQLLKVADIRHVVSYNPLAHINFVAEPKSVPKKKKGPVRNIEVEKVHEKEPVFEITEGDVPLLDQKFTELE